MIKNLIWDLDGTLFDTYPAFLSAIMKVLNELGITADVEWVYQQARISLPHCISEIASRYILDPKEVEDTFLSQYAAIPYADQPLMPGARELCEYILQIGGKNVIVTHRRRSSTEGLLEAHGIAHLFADSITGDEDFPRKPDPTSTEELIMRNGLIKKETLLVGDRELDVKAGQNAGIETCLLGGEIIKSNSDYFVMSLFELKSLILG